LNSAGFELFQSLRAQREFDRRFAVLDGWRLCGGGVPTARRWKIGNDPVLESIETKFGFS
jgi:hypothetical protein